VVPTATATCGVYIGKQYYDDSELKLMVGVQVSFHSGSPRSSSPSVTDEQPLSESVTPTTARRRTSNNLTRANVKAVAAAAERKAQQAAAAGRKASLVGAAGKADRLSVGGSSKADRPNLLVPRLRLLNKRAVYTFPYRW